MSRSTTRRGSDRRNRSAGAIAQPPFRQLTLQYAPIAVISDDEVEAIHAMGLTVLEEIGFRVLASEARALYRRAGAEVDEAAMRVRLDRELVAELVATGAAVVHARRPQSRTGAQGRRARPHLRLGRRPGLCHGSRSRAAHRHLCRNVRLSQAGAVLNILHQEGGGPFEPLDLPADTRHLDLYYAEITLSTRTGSPRRFGQRARQRCLGDGGAVARPLARIAGRPAGVHRHHQHQFAAAARRADGGGPDQLAEHGQVNVITPFTLAGAMSPVTLAGALAQQHAEALAGIALDPDRAAGRAGRCMAASPPMSTCSSGRRPSARRNIRRPHRPPASSRAAIGVPFRSSNATAANASMRRPPMKRRCRYGAR